MWVPNYGGRPPAIGREGKYGGEERVQCYVQVVQTKKNQEHVVEVKYLFMVAQSPVSSMRMLRQAVSGYHSSTSEVAL